MTWDWALIVFLSWVVGLVLCVAFMRGANRRGDIQKPQPRLKWNDTKKLLNGRATSLAEKVALGGAVRRKP